MIYLTGDIHGDLSRFKSKNIKKMKKNDTLLICGDFGFIWDGSKKEKRILKKLGKKKYNILFVEGCHENYDLLYKYPTQEYCGGNVRKISGRLMQMERGSIFTIDGVKIFAFGGGQQNEKDIRKKSNTYWSQEMPTQQELSNALQTLKENGNEVDYIVTHEPPGLMKDFLESTSNLITTNEMNATFNTIVQTCKFKRWYFGKCHKNKVIPPRFECVFTNVKKLDTPSIPKKKRIKK